MANSKDTIYIDIDDEITGIIDKLRGSSGKLVALVLPKRAAVFQSIVNMKLLKRAADESQKHLVLITSEAGLMPLAGAAGIHVAKTLSSKPEVPAAPKDLTGPADEEAIAEDGAEAAAADKTVGELAGPPAAADGVETLELDDDEVPEETPSPAKKAAPAAAAAGAIAAAKKAKDKGGKKFKIPNFGKFRTKLIIAGAALLALILFIIFGLIILPHATINIKTDATNVPVSLNLNLSTSAKSLETDSDTPTVPAKLASEQKTYSQEVPTTGQKNNGSKATGQVNLSSKVCGSIANAPDLPAGSGLTANGQTYITQQDTSFSGDGHIQGGCITYKSTNSTPITAQSAGSSSNTPDGTTFSSGNVSGPGTASGGTDNIVQVVNQNDVNKAKSQISSSNDNVEKQRLQNNLKKDGYFAITQTFSAGTPNITQSAQVGAVANSVTVTETITYTMFGAHEKDLDTLVDNAIKSQIDTGKQSILDEGLDKAVFGVSSSSDTSAQLTMQTTAEVGPDLDTEAIKQQALGKKPNDVKTQLQNNPDVTDVNVKLSPFWVSSVPKKAGKVHIKIAKPTTTKSTNNANNP